MAYVVLIFICIVVFSYITYIFGAYVVCILLKTKWGCLT